MLEKNKKNCADEAVFAKSADNVQSVFFDAHFHLYHCIKTDDKTEVKANDKADGTTGDSTDDKTHTAEHIPSYIKNIHGISCSQTSYEWEQNQKFIQSFIQYPQKSALTQDAGILKKPCLFTETNIINAAGLHPYDISQDKTDECDSFIQWLFTECEKQNMRAIGETGFDFFTDELKQQEKLQDKYFLLQLELAKHYGLPLIIHCRKAVHKLYQYAEKLSKLPSVLLHSFPGNSTEALNLERQIPCCYFGFGGQLLRGSTKACECLMNLPVEKILLETDAPYQPQKNQIHSKPQDIITVYQKAFGILCGRPDIQDAFTFKDFTVLIEKNYRAFIKL